LNVVALADAWDTVIARGRDQGSFLGAALAACKPARVEGQLVVLELSDDNPIHREALERQRAAVEDIVSAVAGSAARVQLAPSATAARPVRLTEEGVRAERLQKGRKKDPALDVAATVLDLELLE
jgi:hypothetical protein